MRKYVLNVAIFLSGMLLAGIGGAFMYHHLSPKATTNVSPAQGRLVSGAPAERFDFIAAAERTTPSVVHISAKESETLAQERHQNNRMSDPFRLFFGEDFFGRSSPFTQPFHRRSGSGSGVIIDDAGYIVTNNHVVEFADEIEVTTYDNRVLRATKVGVDPNTDLAVLKVESSALTPINFGDSDETKVGEWVLAVGNPFSYLTSTVTAGIVSAKGRDLDLIGDGRSSIESFIQTDAAVNPGNSGGALVNTDGELIGINTAIATPTGTFAGYSFAIPVNLMASIVNDIIEYGSPQRGILGIEIANMDASLADQLSIKQTQGVYIVDLIPGGAALLAGLHQKDVIIEANGVNISNVPELQAVVASKHIGDVVHLTVIRRGDIIDIPVRIKARL